MSSMGESRDPSDVTSPSLLERARHNNAEAWERLVRLYSPLVYHWCKRSGLDGEDAADVLQEVFRAVSRALPTFTPEGEAGSFRGWLWTITRNKLRDHFRSVNGRPTPEGGTDAQQRLTQIPDAEPDDEQSTELGTTGVVRRALEMIRGDFSETTWRAFWRTAVEDQSAAHVAGELGISVDAVYQAKSRVMRRLREEMRGLSEHIS